MPTDTPITNRPTRDLETELIVQQGIRDAIKLTHPLPPAPPAYWTAVAKIVALKGELELRELRNKNNN